MAQGVGHLDIGIGQGSAQVFNPMPAIQQYAQILEQRRAKHDAEVKQLGDELAKGYDPNGLRNDADRSEYIKQYNDIKAKAIDAENEKDNTKKALALSAVRQQLADLGSFANGSKKQGIFERQLAMEHLQNPYLYDDDTAKKILEGNGRVWNDPNNITNPGQVVRGVDPNKMEAEYQKTNADLLKNHTATYGPETIKYGQSVFGRKTATGTSDRVIPYKDLLEMHLHRATADMNYQKYLNDKYPQLTDPNQQKQLALRVAQDVADHGQQNGLYDKPKVKEYEDRSNELTPGERITAYHWNLEHNPDGSPKYGRSSPDAPAEPVDNFPIQYNSSADNGGFAIHAKNFVPLSSTNKEFAGSADVDVTNGGKPTGDAVTIRGNIAGVGDFPVYKSGAKVDGKDVSGTPGSEAAVKAGHTQYKRMVLIENKDATGDVKQYLLDYNKLPANIKNSKQVKDALGKFDKTPVGDQNQTYKAGDKSYTHKQLLDLGYTDEQIEQAKKLGTLK